MSRIVVSFLLLFAASLFAEPAPVGDGRDSDSTTFSFHPESKTAKLLDAQGLSIKPDDVKSSYGKDFAIYCNGVDICSVAYAWKQGYGGDDPLLQPTCMDLSDWNKAKVEPGYVAIDPATAKIKFAGPNRLPDGQETRFVKRIQMGNLYGEDFVVKDGFVYATLSEETRGMQVVDMRDPMHPKYAGYCPLTGFSASIEVVDNYAYVHKSLFLAVIDVSDPYNVKLVRCMSGFSASGKLRRRGDRLYTGHDKGIVVYDISDRDDPVPLATREIGDVFDFVLDGEYMYILQGWTPGRVLILRLLENDTFSKVGELDLGCNLGSTSYVCSERIVVDGYFLYVTDSEALKVIDVSDKANPKVVGKFPELCVREANYDQTAGGFSLVKRGNLLYVGGGASDIGEMCKGYPPLSGLTDHPAFKERKHKGGVWILDVQDPANIREVSHIDDLTVALAGLNYIAVDGNTLYVMCWSFGLVMFDISDPEYPKELGNISLAGEVENARLIGDKLYAAGNGLYVVDPYPAEEAELLGYCWTRMWLFGRAVIGKAGSPYVFFEGACPNRIIDVSNPRDPKIAEYYTVGLSWGQWIGDRMYTTRGYVPGIHDPGPRFDLIEKWNIPVQQAVGREKEEIRKGFIIYDMTNPRNPVPISRYETEEGLGGMTVRDNYAYCICYNDYAKTKVTVLYVLDISDEKDVKLASRTELEWADDACMYSGSIYLKDNYLFLPAVNMVTINWGDPEMSREIRGARVIDVSDPRNPKLLTTLEAVRKDIHVYSCDGAQSFYIRGNRLYVADYGNGLGVFDISDMENSRHVAHVDDEKYPWSSFSSATSINGYGRYLYKTMFGGVDILEIPTESDVPKGKMTVMCRLGE